MRAWTKRVISASLVMIFVSMVSPGIAHASSQASAPKLVPTTTCGTSQAVGVATASALLRGHQPPASSAAYDEQLGMTFTQSFSALEYNVTAVVQTDSVLDTGPGYLLNGLANTGYWYQVGLSWNWSPGQVPGTGFAMNYEVFDTSQNSIFPTNGGGGVQAFSGSVNQGDTVLLNLYFANSSDVVMAAKDLNTGSFALETYSALSGTCFVGSPSSPSNSNGYFTGLMTEWYHGDPYFANGKQVTYTDNAFPLSSAWMWMDEFNSNTLRSVFSANTPSPVGYGTPTKLQEFSYNGTNVFSSAYEFLTGNATSTAPPTEIPLTLSYSVLGTGTGYAAPVLTYVTNGVQLTAALNTTASTVDLDQGSAWSVSQTLTGSSTTQRWETEQTTTGVANSAQTITLQYYHQYQIGFSFGVTGGGTGFTAPAVTYQSFGSPQTLGGLGAQLPSGGVWADAASRYSYTNPLSGSSAGGRWYSVDPTGMVSASGMVVATYYHQYAVAVDASFTGSGIFPSVALRSTAAGSPFLGTVIQGAISFWLDANASYSLPQTISLSQGERWATNSSGTGSVSAELSISMDYQYQYYVSTGVNSVDGGTISTTSGWYPSGTSLQLTASPSSGWKFEGWSGLGETAPSAALSLLLSAPVNLTALFYPGITVTATGPLTISYQDGSASGNVPAGTSTVVYAAPSSTLSLRASSPPFLYSFTGWNGASSSTASDISLTVNGPEAVTANSSYNYLDIVIILVAAILIVMGALLAVRRPKKPVAGI